MKMEDKCSVSFTVPPGRGIVIISKGTNKESEAKDKLLGCPSIVRIIQLLINCNLYCDSIY